LLWQFAIGKLRPSFIIDKGENMKTIKARAVFPVLLAISLVLSSCSALAPEPTATSTPNPTATKTLVPTATFTPTATPRPTRTPNLAATQHAEELNAEAKAYFDLGYLSSSEGEFFEYDDFKEEWAQLGWYNWWILDDRAADFYMKAHFKWSSAYRNADISGCGFLFAIQENGDHYAIFLDRTKILFLVSDHSTSYSRFVGLTRGTGRVKFNNPADAPVEADFTLIVKDTYAYVLVDDEVVGEYTLAQSKILKGNLGLTLLSGTNKDFGTRCEMTNIHAFVPDN
jgi:hypothetical protein